MKKLNRKTLKIGSFTLISTAIILAIIVFVNLLVAELPSTVTSIDTTSQKLYDIGDETRALLSGIKEDITIYMLAEGTSSDQTVIQVEEFIQKYSGTNSHIKYERVDPAQRPAFAKKYTDETLTSAAVIVTNEAKSKVVNGSEWFMYETQYGEMDPSTYQSYQAYGYVDGTDPLMFYGEMKLTGAISYVTSEDMPVIYFTSGHGEATLNSTFSKYIENENMEIKSVNIMSGDGTIPADCSVLFINMPQTDLLENEVSAIKEYHAAGGNVMLITYCLYYNAEAMPNLTGLAETMGLTTVDGFIIEGDRNHYMQYPYYLIPNIAPTGPTSTLSNYTMISAYAHGIAPAENTDAAVLKMLTTSDKAFIKKDVENLSTYEKEEGDVEGSFCTAAVAETKNENTSSSYFTWFSSPCSVDPNYDMGGGNSALFTSVLNMMCGKETNVSILGVNVSISPLTASDAAVATWGIVLIGLVPVAVLSLGFVVWIRRRRK